MDPATLFAAPAPALATVISTALETMGGVPVFRETRVYVETLSDYLDGEDLEAFLDDFPTVTREQAQVILMESRRLLLRPYELVPVAHSA